MNGLLCLGLASTIAAALVGDAAVRNAVKAGYAASLPTDMNTPEGRANLRYFGRKYALGPALMAWAVLFAVAGGALTMAALK